MSGRWCKIPNAVGAIDGTSLQIYRPSVEPQEQYYSGHRQHHAVHTQVVVDNEGIIRFVQSGFLGHMNDAQQFAMMQRIGTDLVFPHDCFLLGDKIYPNRYPIITPFSAGQVARRHGRDRRRCVKFNRYVSSCRIIVEHSIGELKTYRAVSTIWRHPRYLLPSVVVICAGLVCRRKELNLIM
ncbi:uncharacterized protein LOC128553052 [Mercenaria mercenaria]|uniref:uncharacterized protein LOC128553052 n=1 Tax=Mercenaria mercenaria TaxID=6596 RepID=UPI00234E4F93|nr:uncharacterized protein LOC128553052 [Mercenaria mercenaria]